jgi:putative hemolysin
METAIIIVCLILSAFFSGMEIAYVSSNKVYLEVEKKQSSLLSKVLTRLTENPTQFITSMLVGNSIVLVVYGYYMGNAVAGWFNTYDIASAYKVILQIFITGFIILLTAEFFPKVFCQIYANALIKVFAVPAYVFYFLFKWIVKFVVVIADFILINVLRTRGEKQQAYFSRHELGNYITEQMNGVDEQEEVDSEIQIFRNALEFSDLKARDIMTPRTEIAAVELNDTVDELKQLFIETGYSKILVYEGTMDNIVGYVHSFDLFRKPASVSSAMIPIEVAPQTIYIKELLNILTRKRKSMAVVLDEYGGTSGIVTVEDIIEELFGEIEDEHDEVEDFIEKELPDGSYLFSARLEVEYINEKYAIGIPEADAYSTLGGFIVYNNNDIPDAGRRLSFGQFDIVIEEASNKKIEMVKVIPNSLK